MKKLFIAFAIEDKFARDDLVYQAQQEHTPFEFVDMSVREPFYISLENSMSREDKRA